MPVPNPINCGARSARGCIVDRTGASRSVVQSRRQQSIGPIVVLAVEEVVKPYLGFNSEPLEMRDRLDGPAESQIKRKEVIVPHGTRNHRRQLQVVLRRIGEAVGRGVIGRCNGTHTDQLLLREESCVHKSLSGRRNLVPKRIAVLVEELLQITDLNVPPY